MISRPRAVRLSLSASRAALCVAALFAIAAAEARARRPPAPATARCSGPPPTSTARRNRAGPATGSISATASCSPPHTCPDRLRSSSPTSSSADRISDEPRQGRNARDRRPREFSLDPSKLPMRLRLRRTPLCERGPETGEPVVVATPEAVARSRILPPEAIPRRIRAASAARPFPTWRPQGNSGSGVFDAWSAVPPRRHKSQIHDRSQGRAAPESRHREIFRARAGDPGRSFRPA